MTFATHVFHYIQLMVILELSSRITETVNNHLKSVFIVENIYNAYIDYIQFYYMTRFIYIYCIINNVALLWVEELAMMMYLSVLF